MPVKNNEDQEISDAVASEHDKTFAAGTVVGCLGTALLLLVVMAMCGCGATPAQQVMRSANDYAYFSARYKDNGCAAVVAQRDSSNNGCVIDANTLAKWYAALVEAKDALTRGGAFPLQLQRLLAIEKEFPVPQ